MGDVKKVRKDKKMKRERKHEEAGENEISGIGKLTDDCLIEIFQHLTTIADKIRIERVCKRWQNLSQRSWSNFKSLDFSAKRWGMEEYGLDQHFIRSIDFDKIMRLSGRYLTSISTDVGKFIKMCHLLPKIIRLHLIDDCLDKNKKCTRQFVSSIRNRNYWESSSQCTYDTWKVILSWLISHSENITNFKIEVLHSHFQEMDFASLLGNMQKLKSFHLYNCEYLDWSGTFLLELPCKIIQEIILTSADMLPFDIHLLSTMIRKCEMLQTLGIYLERCEEPGVLELVSSHAASLKNFKLQLRLTWNRQWQSVLLTTIATLTHLKKLDLSHCWRVNDKVLEAVVKNCNKLTHLNLRECFDVTDHGISSIGNLENLEYLNIGYMQKIKNPSLDKLTSLVVLDSCGSHYLQEECLCTFLKEAHQLRALDIRHSISVTNKLFDVAVEVAQIRESKKELDLYFNRTVLDIGVVVKKTPLLNIIDFGLKRLPLAKYDIEDPFNIQDPEVYIY